jgi:RHS repeat-associated protein
MIAAAPEFTGKPRDYESGLGLDYFGARYLSSAQGRFTTPDEFTGGIVDAYSGGQMQAPGPLPYADITDPQTINKYAYVRNNPLRYVDPDGHTWAEFFEGGADTTYRPVVQAAVHPVDTAVALGSAVAHPFDTAVAITNSVMATGTAVLSGDHRALGEVTGTVVSAVATAGAAKAVSALAKGAGAVEVGAASGARSSFNPFKGKSAAQVGAMFEKKGFEAVGPDALGGKGGYVNPRTGRSYHIDPGGSYKKGTEGPHVDINRPRGSNMPKRKLPLGEEKPNEP